MNILFLCTANKNRSRTAEVYFQEHYPQHQFRSAGLNQRMCMQEGTTLVSESMLAWADWILVMEDRHRERIQQHTGTQYLSKIMVLHIEDSYTYMQPELIELVRFRMKSTQHFSFLCF